MRKPYLIVLIAIVAFGICATLQIILNKRTESKIADVSQIIDRKSTSKDSLQSVVDFSKNERTKFTSQLGDTPKLWENLEYTLTFSNARTSVYYSLDQEFVEECKQLGYKDSESFFDYITEHSLENEKKRIAKLVKLNTQISSAIETRQKLQSEIIKFTSVIIWTLILILSSIAVLFLKKATNKSKTG
jgi:hypothetical protein